MEKEKERRRGLKEKITNKELEEKREEAEKGERR